MARYYCRKKMRFLNEYELQLHHCLEMKKGKRKGKPCSKLIRM